MATAAMPQAAPVTPPAQDPTPDNPKQEAGEQALAQQGLEPELQKALLEIRTRFKQQYQPKRIIFIRECMKAFEALRGNTYALLNDSNAALDTINELMQGLVDGGDDPAVHDHNENIFQMFCLSFIAALMVNLGKVRYQPADADDEADVEISKKGSTIHAYNERVNDEDSLNQLKLLYLWCTGSFFRYVRYKITEEAGFNYIPQIEMQNIQVSEDRYICPQCGAEIPEKSIPVFQQPTCPQCGGQLQQSDFYGGEMMDLPVKVGDLEAANGMTSFDIVSGMNVDVNPDAQWLRDTEILDYQLEVSAGVLRAEYPSMYNEITPAQGSDVANDGEAARMGRQLQTTPGSNSKPLTTEGLITYSRCWITPKAYFQLEDQSLAERLKKKFPKGCKLSICGAETFLDAVPERLLDHWTWCGTIKGLGMYPFAVGKVVLDCQERLTDVVNIEHAYLARVAFGTILYDADYIDGNALASRFLTPGNMTPVSRTTDEGTAKSLNDLMYQPELRVDPRIFDQSERITARAQLLAGILPQIFGGSDPHVETKGGQEQALSTALGRLKQFVNQMRGESARAARISVKCSIDNMDEEVKIVEETEKANTYQSVRLLRAELQGDFFTYPEPAEGFPSTYEQIQQRIMTLLTSKQLVPALAQMMSDPDNAATIARYVLPDQMTLPGDEQRAKVKKVINRLAQEKPGLAPDPSGKPIPVPSISPEPDVDDPKVCMALAKKWLLKNFDQEQTNPGGYANVLAYLKVTSRLAKQQMADAAMEAQQAQQAA